MDRIFPKLVFLFLVADFCVLSAVLKGRITDQSGAVISGATVSAIGIERGLSRQATTDAEGDYQIPLLQPGRYELRVEAEGFRTHRAQNITLTVGQVGVVDVQLAVGAVNNELTVTAVVPLVETERTQQANTIERRQIENLPNVGRNFTDIIFTLPGVVSTNAGVAQSGARFGPQRSSGISVGGGNGRYNYFTIDGGENESGTGALRIRNMSIEAVQEYQVNRNAFAAEYGFTAGTAINVVTRSGTNNFHGGGYVFYRSQHTSARNAFDFVSEKNFEQRLFPGFTLSGPIAKNKAFFFTSFEALKFDEARFKAYTSNPALFAITAAQTAYLNTLRNGPDSSDNTRRIAANLRNALTITTGTLDFLHGEEGGRTLPTRTHNWTTRLDYQINSRDNLTGRFTLADENNTIVGASNLDSFGRGSVDSARDYSAVATWSHIFNQSLVNQARVQFAKDLTRQDLISDAPTINIAGIINYGRSSTNPNYYDQKRYQFEDVLLWNKAGHNLKFGFSYRPNDLEIYNEIGGGGVFTFAGGLPLTLAVPAADRPALAGPLAPPATSTLIVMQAFQLGLPQLYQQGFGDARFTGTQHNLGIFAQDSWKLTPRFTLDFGLRFDYDGEPQPLYVNQSISPRFGFAWDVFGNGRTVVRGGGGTFYAPVTLMVFTVATLQSDKGDHLVFPTRTIADGSSAAVWAYGVSAGKLPNTPLTADDLRALGITIGPKQPGRRVADPHTDYDNPSSIQASFGLSQQLARDLAVEVAWQYYHGVHLPMGIEGNYREALDPAARCRAINPNPASQPLACQNPALYGPVLEPIDPTISQKVLHTSWGNSVYHGLTASLSKRFSNHSQFQVNYTFAKTLDDVIDYQGPAQPFLSTRRYLDRALSSFDIRHNFVASGVFDSPFKNALLRDITLSPIVALRSGVPFNLYIGRDANGDVNTTDRPFNAPRNSGIGPSFYRVDLRLNKRFVIKEDFRVEFIAEATNLFNRTNFLRVNDTVCGATCDPKFLTGPFDFKGSKDLPATAPLGFTAAHPGRQVQFGLKVAF